MPPDVPVPPASTIPAAQTSAANPRLETFLAFGFGFVFCCLLAYAALRSTPITNAYSFFLLRVLASISAAGIAAVIPGLLEVNIGAGSLLALRGAGALAVFLLVYKVNPPELLRPADESVRVAMESNYKDGLYDDADRLANQIIKDAPDDAEALNIKGGIRFYNHDYPQAAELFARAHKSNPTSQFITSNLANAYVEVGAYNKALDLFHLIDDQSWDRSFLIGRAYLYNGDFNNAITSLQGVPIDYWMGAARVLEAAAYKLAANAAPDATVKAANQTRVIENLSSGLKVDKTYWNNVFANPQYDKHISYNLPVTLLADDFNSIGH